MLEALNYNSFKNNDHAHVDTIPIIKTPILQKTRTKMSEYIRITITMIVKVIKEEH